MIYGNTFIDNNIDFILMETNMTINDPINLAGNQFGLWVYGGEGPYPHFHLKGNGGFEACIMIQYPEYFDHGGKYKDKLKSKYCKLLNEWMQELDSNNISNWCKIVNQWNENNSKYKILHSKRPDYSNIYPYHTFTK